MDDSDAISKGDEDFLSEHMSADSEAGKNVARFLFLEITLWNLGESFNL